MAKFKEHQKALLLRKQGKSYSQIKSILGVSKSSLSLWLREYPLSEKRLRELRDFNECRIEKYIETRRKQREARLAKTYIESKKRILPLSNKSLHTAGLFLYWGEGGKSMREPPVISNTNPDVILFSMFWMVNLLDVPKKNLKFRLHLYNDMDVEAEHKFWQKYLKVKRKQFRKPYVKKTNSHSITFRTFGHGTCEIHGGTVRLKEQIMMDIKAICDKHNMGA